MRLQYKAGIPTGPLRNAAVFLFEDDRADLGNRPELAGISAVIAPLLKNGQFKPLPLAELPVMTEKGWLFLVGLGVRSKLTPAGLLEGAALAVKAAEARRCLDLDFFLPQPTAITAEDALELAVCGGLLALYRQTEFKSDPGPKPALAGLRFRGGAGLKNPAAVIARGRAAAEAVCLARRLGDCPPNVLYPESFAREAQALAKPLKLRVEVLDEKGLAKARLGLIAAVGGGSARKPRLVTVKYQGAGAGRRPVVLVGKGITFDSGGLSLKPSTSLEGMKTDMAGAATVLAVALAAARLKMPVNLTAVMPLAENMPDGAAVRVGDVVTTRSGRTVEITNTDAEGRLVLAEALTWAGGMKPAAIIDVATLTGACVVALGDRCAGLFTDDEDLRARLLEASRLAGEPVWPLPLLDEYEENLKSDTADLINAPGVPRGGAINAALFLRRFVDPNVPWAHLDIAGPGRAGKARPGTTVGATGFAARTLLRFLAAYAGKK
ncbi:leucyl aminopeptidase [Deltaproteobacteria bacterium OttesenSCG-928-M10]|nr:leucyl aminopeptidase [Deltaproteobacteria bacterium OttesenSCG-928-M10]